MSEENVFEEAEVSEELLEDEQEEVEGVEESWAPTVSSESPKDKLERKGKKEKMDGQDLVITEVFFTRPKTRDFEGNPIEAKKTQSKENPKKFYPGKLGLKFENNIVEYYPNFHYFLNDNGKVSNVAKINRGGDNAIARLFKLAIAKMDLPMDEVSDQDFYDWLVGKTVKIGTVSGTYLGNEWFRNDIVEFI
jgi:hypothetical protein